MSPSPKKLVQKICGPSKPCVKKKKVKSIVVSWRLKKDTILWQFKQKKTKLKNKEDFPFAILRQIA